MRGRGENLPGGSKNLRECREAAKSRGGAAKNLRGRGEKVLDGRKKLRGRGENLPGCSKKPRGGRKRPRPHLSPIAHFPLPIALCPSPTAHQDRPSPTAHKDRPSPFALRHWTAT